jgi:hypothetical protein
MAAAAETSSYRLRADEARAEERAVLQDLAQARAQLTDALERQAHRSAAAARPASGTATAVSLEVDVAVRTEQLEAARTLLRKVTADVRSLEAECAQFETPHGAVGVRGRLSDAQLRELLRRSYEAPLAARKQAAKRIERELKSQAQLARGKPVPAARLDDMTKRLSLPVRREGTIGSGARPEVNLGPRPETGSAAHRDATLHAQTEIYTAPRPKRGTAPSLEASILVAI